MAKVYNCSDCDYCYSNNTMGELHLCVNGSSDYIGEPVDWLGLADDDMECVIVNGKDRDELRCEDDIEEEFVNADFTD